MLDARVVKKRREFVVDVALQLGAGETIALFGASGAGKSTVLACIAGIEQPDAGHIRADGRDLFPTPPALHERNIGYLTQRSLLFPHLSVEQNILFGVSRDKRPDSWLAEIKDRFGLAAIWRAPATSISGGQAQRVALARMLARRQPLVLLDEPFAGLDRIVTRDLIGALDAWQRAHRVATIIVDHQENVLRKLCDRVYVLERGRIIQEGSWYDLESKPASRSLAQLLTPL